MTNFRELPPPGVYEGVMAAHYHGWRAISSTRLGVLDEATPAHLAYDMENPTPPTPTQAQGSALHTLTLEPKLFSEWYILRPEGNANSNAYKAAAARIAADHPFATLLKPDVWDDVHRSRDAIMAHPGACAIIESCPQRELSLVWEEEVETTPEGDYVIVDTFPAKGRLDLPSQEFGLYDLKSTAKVGMEAFGRDAWNFGYPRQLAFYDRGAAKAGLKLGPSRGLIVAEKAPPYLVSVQAIPLKYRVAAEGQIEMLSERFGACVASGNWTGYPPGETDIRFPHWAESTITLEPVDF